MISQPEEGAPRILVTGASGFIGRAIIREGIRKGLHVFGAARAGCSLVPCVSTSFDVAELASAIREIRPSTIFHAVGRASVLASEEDEEGAYCDTVMPLRNVLEAVSQATHRCRLIFVSSAAVYGEPQSLPISESAVLNPISAYGRQRVECESIARSFASKAGLPVIAARAFSLFVAEQRRLLVWELFSKFMHDHEVVIQGTGLEMRDFLDVDTFARALMLMKDIKTDGYLAINVASGRGTTAEQLVELWRKVLSVEKPLVCLGKRAGHDPAQWCADIGLFRKLTGISENYDLASALGRVAQEWR